MRLKTKNDFYSHQLTFNRIIFYKKIIYFFAELPNFLRNGRVRGKPIGRVRVKFWCCIDYLGSRIFSDKFTIV